MQMLGHEGPPTNYWTDNLITGAALMECPLRTILRVADADPALTNEFDRYTGTYYPAYQDGHLLVSGGISDQPARYLEYILAIRDTEAAVQTKHDAVKAANEAEG